MTRCSATVRRRSGCTVSSCWAPTPATRSNRLTDHAPVRIRMRHLRTPLREDSEVLRSARGELPEMRRRRTKTAVFPRHSVQGERLVYHRLREEGLELRERRKGRDGRDGREEQGRRRY